MKLPRRQFLHLAAGAAALTAVPRDLQGRPIGKEELKPGDDPTVIAKRILRRGRAQRDFFRPISYPPLSLV